MTSTGFAVVTAPQAVRDDIALVRVLAAEFFARPQAERQALGKLRLFKDKVVGYRELGGGRARFLEVHAIAGGGAIPRPKAPKGLNKAAERLYLSLQGLARELISWLARHKGIPEAALLQCLDGGTLENLEDGDIGSSVLRLGWYGCEAEGEAEPGTGAETREHKAAVEEVVFDEHTDASFLTLAAVGSTPGLQMRDPSGSLWLDVERQLSSDEGDLVVFIGDFLEVLTKSSYLAARHRVVQTPLQAPEPSGAGQEAHPQRLSMPFLVRGQPSAIFDTRSFLEDCPSAPLLPLEAMPYVEMRRFLDLKGRTRFQGKELLATVKADQEAPQ